MNKLEDIIEKYLEAREIGKEAEFLKAHPDYKDELKDFSLYITALKQASEKIEMNPLKKRQIRESVTRAPAGRFNLWKDLWRLREPVQHFSRVFKPVAVFAVILFIAVGIWLSGLYKSGDKLYVNSSILQIQSEIINLEEELKAIEAENILLNETEGIFSDLDKIIGNL